MVSVEDYIQGPCYCLILLVLQPRASCLAMGVSKQPQVGHKDPAGPEAGANHP